MTGAQRRRLRGLAHALEPVVRVGRLGVGEAVLSEIDGALERHELIKVRFLGGREDLRSGLERLVAELGAHVAGVVGHVVILYRPHPDPERRRIEL